MDEDMARTTQQLIDAWNRGDDNARLELRRRDENKSIRGVFIMSPAEAQMFAQAGVKTYADLMKLANHGTKKAQAAFRAATGITCIRCLDRGVVWPNGFREAPWSQRCSEPGCPGASLMRKWERHRRAVARELLAGRFTVERG